MLNIKKSHKCKILVIRLTSVLLSAIIIASLFSVGFTVNAEQKRSETSETVEVSSAEETMSVVSKTTDIKKEYEEAKSTYIKDTELSSEKIRDSKEKIVTKKKEKVATGAASSGSCGENVTWSFDSSNNTLTISGQGRMKDYSLETPATSAPWYSSYKNAIQKIIFDGDISHIGDNCFFGCTAVTSITIPSTCWIMSIGNSAFYGCTNLQSITNLRFLTTIENSAFKNCKKLKNISNLTCVESIGAWAFENCQSLEDILISNSVTSIGYSAFSGCSALKAVYINDIESWCNISFNNLESNPLYYAQYLYLNNNLVTDLVIPNTITAIKDYTFCHCQSLTKVSIPINVVNIGKQAFSGCSALKAVYINDIESWCNISFNSMESNPLIYANNLYLNNVLVTNLVIPEGVESIGDYAFYNCQSLENISIPGSVTSVGLIAFECCDNLKEVHINNIESWCNIEFSDRSSNPLYYAQNLYLDNNILSDLIIPEGVKSIGDYAFYNCQSLENISISGSVTSIGAYAFYKCLNVNEVPELPDNCVVSETAFLGCGYITGSCGDNVTYIFEKGTLTISGSGQMESYKCNNSIPGYAYWIGKGSSPWYEYREKIKSVIIKEGVTSIGEAAFEDCRNLSSVTMANTVYSIDQAAFYKCTSLSNIELSNNINFLNKCCFYGCTAINYINIPDSVRSIDDYAFGFCTSLINKPTLPSNCNTAERVFWGCPFETINYDNINCTFVNGTLTISGSGNMPEFDNKKYRGDKDYCPWVCSKELVKEVIINDGITDIYREVFRYCINLKNVSLPNTLTTIGDHSFSDCKNLNSINLDSVSSIGDFAFYKCSLNSIYIGNNDMSGTIGVSAFAYCNSLVSCVISDGVQIINTNAFRGCTNLSSIVVGNFVTRINKGAFFNCSKANVVLPETVNEIEYGAFYKTYMVICPLDTYAYNLLTDTNFTKYRNSSTRVVGIVSKSIQLTRILQSRGQKAPSAVRKKRLNTGATKNNFDTGDDSISEFEETLTAEEIKENLSHIQCYVVEDITIDEPLTFDSELDVVLHLNDFKTDSKGNVKLDSEGKIVDGETHIIKGANAEPLIEVPGNLTITTAKEANGGIINNKGSLFDIKDGGNLIIENGTYSEDVSEYIDDNKLISKTNNNYTVIDPSTKDLNIEDDGREVIMPNNQSVFSRNEFVGVQIRKASERNYFNENDYSMHTVALDEAMRFVSVVRTDILRGADDYGYILVKGRNYENMKARQKDIYNGSEGCVTVSLKGSKNTLANTEYSSNNLNEGKYKYLTAAVHHIDDGNTAVGARFYIKRTDGTYVYSDYTCISTMNKLKNLIA